MKIKKIVMGYTTEKDVEVLNTLSPFVQDSIDRFVDDAFTNGIIKGIIFSGIAIASIGCFYMLIRRLKAM